MSAGLEQLAELVHRETGMVIKGSQLSSLAAAVSRLGPGTAPADFLAAGGVPPELLERLIDEVTVKETFFFRQREELDAIDWPLLLETARASGSDKIRVWVAACASGEEAYTLAMLAGAALGTLTPPLSILATDISGVALRRASEAHYHGRSLRSVPDVMRTRYMVPRGDGAVVDDSLRRLVSFQRHNLVSDPPPLAPGKFELIACRNVLIYFDGETVERVIGGLESALAPGGTMVLGAADRLCDSARRLARGDGQRRHSARERAAAPRRVLRRPLGREAEPPVEALDLKAALDAADSGDLERAIEITGGILEADVLDAGAYFVRGLAELGLGDCDGAVGSLRRALYVDPGFGLAAFQLGRAQERRGDPAAAARAYDQALRTLDPDDARHAEILDQVDLADVAGACSLRVKELKRGAA
ncbi:MAG TPA: CheR family methyltransferase [Thermoleophilaceae bacterium]